MNLCGFSFDSETTKLLDGIENAGRLPHAVLIESESDETANQLAALLSAYAVCKSEDKPCGVCKSCHNALAGIHADITRVPPDKKSKTESYSIDQIRELARDSSIKPNDGDAKVFILERCDARLSEIAQNAFLKLLEEPPKGVYFFLLCKSAKSLLTTILSRCSVIRLKSTRELPEEAVEAAKEIIRGILSPGEYALLSALTALEEKNQRDEVLSAVRLILRDALALVSGADAVFETELSKQLAVKFTRRKIMEMIQLGNDAGEKIKQNINIKLLTTWMCGEYRRISWQR